MKQIRSLIAASRFLGRLLAHDGLVAHTHALVVNRLVHAVLPRGPVRPHVGTSRSEGHQVPRPCTSKKTRRHDTGEAQGARTESERGPLHHSHTHTRTHTHTMQTADSRHQTSDRRGEERHWYSRKSRRFLYMTLAHMRTPRPDRAPNSVLVKGMARSNNRRGRGDDC
jgi:hypothetical protein